jgi:hypothetical protein
MSDFGYFPVLSVKRQCELAELQERRGESFGLLVPSGCSDNMLRAVRAMDRPFFLDSGVFGKKTPWYLMRERTFECGRWLERMRPVVEKQLIGHIEAFFDRADRNEVDYVFAPDALDDPEFSLYLAQLSQKVLESRPLKQRRWQLFGIVQAGKFLCRDAWMPNNRARETLLETVEAYRAAGYTLIALGGLLRQEPSMPMGLKFGLTNDELEKLLQCTSAQFVLGGLALRRLDVLKRCGVAADSSNWRWWKSKYDFTRFGNRDALAELADTRQSSAKTES